MEEVEKENVKVTRFKDIKSQDVEDGLWTVHQVAAYLGIPPSSVYQLNFQNKIPRCYLGSRTVRYRKADIDKFIAERMINVN